MLEDEVYKNAKKWVLQAAEKIKKNDIKVGVKMNHSDLVTNVDREIEAFFVEQIRSHYPDHNIIGEESMNNSICESEYMWIIDPIDGTTNLINRQQDYAISVAFCKEGHGVFGIVFDVAKNKLFHAYTQKGAFLNGKKLSDMKTDSSLCNELLALSLPWGEFEEMDSWEVYLKLASQARGLRVYGATTIELCDMAEGKLGAYVHHNIKVWDYAASRVILEELGCKFSDLEGNKIGWTYNGELVASIPKIQEEIVRSFEVLHNNLLSRAPGSSKL